MYIQKQKLSQTIQVGMAKKASPQDWRAVLVDSFCQSGKTAKCFETINAKIIADGAGATPTLV